MRVLLALGGPLLALIKFKWLIALIPGVGPVLGVALTGLASLIKFVMRGLFGIVTSPASLTAAIVIAMVAVLFGVRVGTKLDAHLVNEANSLLQEQTELREKSDALNARWKDRYALEEKRAEEAKQAADTAEAAAVAAAGKRLRDKQAGAKGGSKEASGPWLPSLPGIQWPAK